MGLHTIKKGLNLPIAGEPEQKITDGPRITRVAVVADDFVGMKPRMAVAEGDRVATGQLLFENRKSPGVMHTSPGAGTVVAVNRGAKRKLETVVVELSGDDHVTFESHRKKQPADYTSDEVRALLQESGMWTTLRMRPFSKNPPVDATPDALFVTAIDTQPLAADPDVVLADRHEDFHAGLLILEKLTEGPVFLCRKAGGQLSPGPSRAKVEEFRGKHPAGAVGTHIHFLYPVSRQRTAWHIGYQDVAAVGHLVRTGRLDTQRVVALAGPVVRKPRLVRTRLGASTVDLTGGETAANGSDVRVISGSVLSGRSANGDVHGFIGCYHNQVSIIREDKERRFLGWMTPGFDRYSSIPALAGWLMAKMGRKFDFTTSTHGSPRAIVPIGMYEKVMPLDILPTHLLRALAVGDVEWAEELGALELDEEDLALCTFVCPGKVDYGPALRQLLDRIDKEG